MTKLNKVDVYAQSYLNKELQEVSKSGRNVESSNLSLAEKSIIFKYSNDGYDSVNQNLRATYGKGNTEFGKLLFRCLSKLPNFSGLVYRGVTLTKYELNGYIKAFENNQPVTELTFVSTSKSRSIANEYGNTLFIIHSKTGKEIERIAKFGFHNPPNEREVLFKPNRKFRVLNVAFDDKTTIIMEEI